MSFDLTGSLLISTPAMGDPRFARSVTYLCAHGPDGAFGLVLNRPLPRLRLQKVLDQLGIPLGEAPGTAPVLAGGPVETQRGFVLHTGLAGHDDGQALFDSLVVQSEVSRLEIETAFGPERMQHLLDLLNDLREITEALPEQT